MLSTAIMNDALELSVSTYKIKTNDSRYLKHW